jgi:hypothetical protein
LERFFRAWRAPSRVVSHDRGDVPWQGGGDSDPYYGSSYSPLSCKPPIAYSTIVDNSPIDGFVSPAWVEEKRKGSVAVLRKSEDIDLDRVDDWVLACSSFTETDSVKVVWPITLTPIRSRDLTLERPAGFAVSKTQQGFREHLAGLPGDDCLFGGVRGLTVVAIGGDENNVKAAFDFVVRTVRAM